MYTHVQREREREIQRDRDREIHRERQRDRETERQRQTETETEREIHRERYRETETERDTERQRQTETKRQRDTQRETETAVISNKLLIKNYYENLTSIVLYHHRKCLQLLHSLIVRKLNALVILMSLYTCTTCTVHAIINAIT